MKHLGERRYLAKKLDQDLVAQSIGLLSVLVPDALQNRNGTGWLLMAVGVPHSAQTRGKCSRRNRCTCQGTELELEKSFSSKKNFFC